jgi:hypothetical protein
VPHENVRRLQIAVNNPLLVGEVHGTGKCFDHLGGFARRLRDAGNSLVQRFSVHEFQREIGQTLVLAYFMDLNDVGMLQPGNRRGLRIEASQLQVAGVIARQDHLDGNRPVQTALPRLVHDAHAAPAQLAQDLVAGYRAKIARAAAGL